jgi:hypothetical protein
LGLGGKLGHGALDLALSALCGLADGAGVLEDVLEEARNRLGRRGNEASVLRHSLRARSISPCLNLRGLIRRGVDLRRMGVVVYDLAALLQSGLHRALGLICHLSSRGNPCSLSLGLSH